MIARFVNCRGLPWVRFRRCKKMVFIVLGPFRMALFPQLWNAGRHRLDNLLGSKHTKLLQLDRSSLTVKGLALPARSRFGEGRSKVLQRTILAGLDLFLSRF